jgi:hypothetical protein
MSRLLLPGMLSAFSKNHCPDCAGISVRIKQESVSVFSKNAVRNQQESLSGLGKNMHLPDDLLTYIKAPEQQVTHKNSFR